MSYFNNCTFLGRLVADPEPKVLPSGTKLCNFSIAVNRPKIKDKPEVCDFVDCLCFNSFAENLCKYAKKGNLILVSGRFECNKVTGNDGVTRYFWRLVCEAIRYCFSSNTLNAASPADAPPPGDLPPLPF